MIAPSPPAAGFFVGVGGRPARRGGVAGEALATLAPGWGGLSGRPKVAGEGGEHGAIADA